MTSSTSAHPRRRKIAEDRRDESTSYSSGARAVFRSLRWNVCRGSLSCQRAAPVGDLDSNAGLDRRPVRAVSPACYRLVMQGDGKPVSTLEGTRVWSSATQTPHRAYAVHAVRRNFSLPASGRVLGRWYSRQPGCLLGVLYQYTGQLLSSACPPGWRVRV